MTLERQRYRSAAFQSTDDIDIDAFAALCSASVDPATVPSAMAIVNKVPVYSADTVREAGSTPEGRVAILAELHDCLLTGPGVFAVDGMMDPAIVDDATVAYLEIIAAEKAAGIVAGDHYADPGLNDRIWNSFQKLADHDPATFAAYFANPVLDLVCQSWLGPGYRMTCQVNVVKPGGSAQRPHRDYHLGFLSNEYAAQFPISMHCASVFLTLQGAVSHSEMSIESGPTRLLPFSQAYDLGYLAYRDPAFQAYFAEHFVQVPLHVGDGLFFNHALFHAAGDNRTKDVERMANLLQISSAFGKQMETIDTVGIIVACYPFLIERYRAEGFSPAVETLMTMAADGYPFPGNLDKTQPVNGLAPPSQRDLLRDALAAEWSLEQISAALAEQLEQRTSR